MRPQARRPRPTGETFQRGLTLIELLVAMVVAVFVLGGILAVLASNKHSYRVQDASNYLQENGRFAASQLAHSIRMASHWGGVEPGEVTRDAGLSITGIGNCDAAWITDPKAPIRGYDGAASISAVAQGLPTGCIPSADYLAGTDILVLRYGVPETTIPQPSILLRSAIGRRAVIGNAPSSGALPTFGLKTEDGTINYGYRIEVWLIRPCSDRGGGSSASACDSADDDGSPIPTLSRLALEGTTLSQQGMYAGIEQLQLEYGRDINGDNRVDRLDTAATLNATADPEATWRQVISVQVALVSRSAQRDATFTGDPQLTLTGDMGAGTSGFRVAAAQQSYLRKSYLVTAQIRNGVR